MVDRLSVKSRADLRKALRSRTRHITLEPPGGMPLHKFIPRLVVYAVRLPQFKGFDVYEVEAIIRSMAAV